MRAELDTSSPYSSLLREGSNSVWIDANFDGGNIIVDDASDWNAIKLRIRPDTGSDHMQWIHFRAIAAGCDLMRFEITNASYSSFPEAWPNCTLVASSDRQSWHRVDTRYQNGSLLFEIHPDGPVIWVALHRPYSYERHQDLIARALSHSAFSLAAIGASYQDRPIEVLSVGSTNVQAKPIWVIARQHPAETMSGWFMEGVIDALIAGSPEIDAMLTDCRMYLVPNTNPDGSVLGNLRCNAAGIDLNRAWGETDPETAPEVAFILEQMQQTGVDLFLDIHGDEDTAFPFAAGCEGVPAITPDILDRDRAFRAALARRTCDFSIQNGYEPDAPGTANLTIAANKVALEFGCLSLTLELPFVDHKSEPDPREGWNAERSKALGDATIAALTEVVF